jgi:hypothetical protein
MAEFGQVRKVRTTESLPWIETLHDALRTQSILAPSLTFREWGCSKSRRAVRFGIATLFFDLPLRQSRQRDHRPPPMASRGHKLGKSVHSAAQRALCTLMVAARKRAGVTQQELASRISKPQSFVAKYEGGERRLDVVEFIAICRAIPADSDAILAKLAKLI